MVIIIAGTGCNAIQPITVVPVGHESDILPVYISVVLSSHVSTAPPCFISNAPEFYMPGFCPSIFFTQVGHGTRAFLVVHIFYPITYILHRAASNIYREIRFGIQFFAHVEEFVCTKTVVFFYISPPYIQHGWSFVFWTYSIFPMISVRETTTWPPKYRDF